MSRKYGSKIQIAFRIEQEQYHLVLLKRMQLNKYDHLKNIIAVRMFEKGDTWLNGYQLS